MNQDIPLHSREISRNLRRAADLIDDLTDRSLGVLAVSVRHRTVIIRIEHAPACDALNSVATATVVDDGQMLELKIAPFEFAALEWLEPATTASLAELEIPANLLMPHGRRRQLAAYLSANWQQGAQVPPVPGDTQAFQARKKGTIERAMARTQPQGG